MTKPEKPNRKSEAAEAGAARRSAEQPPRQDRDRWENFDIDDVRKTRADALQPETPMTNEEQ